MRDRSADVRSLSCSGALLPCGAMSLACTDSDMGRFSREPPRVAASSGTHSNNSGGENTTLDMQQSAVHRRRRLAEQLNILNTTVLSYIDKQSN